MTARPTVDLSALPEALIFRERTALYELGPETGGAQVLLAPLCYGELWRPIPEIKEVRE